MRSFNQEQRRSYTFRYGEPDDHKRAGEAVKTFFDGLLEDGILNCQKYITTLNKKVYFPMCFVSKHKLDYDKHSFDVWIEDRYGNLVAVVEIHQVCDIWVTLENGEKIFCRKSRHSKIKQRINDGIIDNYMQSYYPRAKVYRPEKSDCFSYLYLFNTFREYI